MPITLEAVKAEQTKLAEMIASIEAAMKEPRFFEYQGVRIPLAEGERYVGTVISACGTKSHHIILLPGEIEDAEDQTFKLIKKQTKVISLMGLDLTSMAKTYRKSK